MEDQEKIQEFPKISLSMQDLVTNMCKDLENAKKKKKMRKDVSLQLRKTISRISLKKK